jgi:hypothetical protein
VIAVGGEEVISFDPAAGGLLWRLDHQTPYGIAVSTPVWNGGDMLIAASAYGKGAQGIKLAETGATAWADARIQSHFGSGVIKDGLDPAHAGWNPALRP